MADLNGTITDVQRTMFAHNVYEITTQTESLTSPLFSPSDIERLDALDMMIPRVGSLQAQRLNERFPKIVPTDAKWDARRLAGVRCGAATWMDKWDAIKMLSDPQSILAKRQAEALLLERDRIAVEALNANVFTGRIGTTPVSASTDGVLTVDAKSALNFDILLKLDENFQAIGVPRHKKKFLLISEQEHSQLMREGTLTHGDFSKQYVIDQGGMDRAYNFQVIVFGSKIPNPILRVASNVRSCWVIVEGSLKMGVSQSSEIEIGKVQGHWHTDQVLTSMIQGVTRMEGSLIQEVQTTAY